MIFWKTLRSNNQALVDVRDLIEANLFAGMMDFNEYRLLFQVQSVSNNLILNGIIDTKPWGTILFDIITFNSVNFFLFEDFPGK
jgi:hypothetical protein